MTSSVLIFPIFISVSLQEDLVLEADDIDRRIYSELSIIWLLEIVFQALYDHLENKLIGKIANCLYFGILSDRHLNSA